MQDDKKTRATFAMTMYGIAEDFGGALSDNNLHVRFEALKEYSIDQITQAGTWLLKNRTEKFPAVPTTKEFIDAIRSAQGELVNPATKAAKQHDIVMKYFKHNWTPYNGYTHNFKDPITDYMMSNTWSFQMLGRMTLDELKWFRKNFIDAYQDYSNEGSGIQAVIEGPKNGNVIGAGKLKQLANVTLKRI